ncbi:MAG: hypothetical protein WBB69_00520 [Anaerolineales bacterium]
MNRNIDLKQTEQTSFKLAAYADGINDISLGLVIILLGIYPLTRAAFGVNLNMLFFLVVLGIIVFGQKRLKARLTPSRIGLVKFGDAAHKRLKVALLITSVLLALTAVTWGLSGQDYFLPAQSWLGTYGFDIFFALAILVIFSAMAYTLQLTRYYLYGLLFGASLLLQAILSDRWFEGLPVLLSGVIIVGIGVYLLTRFLKEFPAVAEEG